MIKKIFMTICWVVLFLVGWAGLLIVGLMVIGVE